MSEGGRRTGLLGEPERDECRLSSSSQCSGRRGNPPDPVAAVVGDEQRAVGSDSHADRTSPLLNGCAVLAGAGQKAGQEVFDRARLAIDHREEHRCGLPDATVRFHDPCSATNPPLRYLAGNCEPV